MLKKRGFKLTLVQGIKERSLESRQLNSQGNKAAYEPSCLLPASFFLGVPDSKSPPWGDVLATSLLILFL